MHFGLDYISLSKGMLKDTTCLTKMEYTGCNYHIDKFKIRSEFMKPLDCTYNNNTQELKVFGSLPYFLQGHNIKAIPSNDLIESLNLLGEELKLNLFNFEVNVLEYGGVLEIPFHFDRISNSHISLKGKEVSKINGLHFISKYEIYKFYNPVKNMQKKVTPEIRNSLYEDGILNKDSNYVRIEKHYKNLTKSLNLQELILGEIFNPDIEYLFKKDLLRNYMNIEKKISRALPKEKKLLYVEAIYHLILLDEYGSLNGINAKVKEKLAQIPNDILTYEDRKARKRHIKDLDKRFPSIGSSDYDLTEALSNALGMPKMN